MSGGRTTWWAKDAAWWRRTRIVEVGQAEGPAGLAVLDWLTCEAKSQGPMRGHDGTVKTGWAAIAYGCFIGDTDTVRRIVNTLVDIGLLDDFDEVGERMFTCRISGWKEDVERPLAATRKASQRAGDTGGHVGTNDQMSPECPPTHTSTHTETTSSADAEPSVAPADVANVFAAWQQSKTPAGGRPSTAKLDAKRRRLIRRAIDSHGLDDVLAAVVGWKHSPHHRGENPAGTVYNDLGLLLRDAEHIERFRDLERGARSPLSVSGESLRDLAARMNQGAAA